MISLTNREERFEFYLHSFKDVGAVLEARAHWIQRQWRVRLDFGRRPSRRRVKTDNEHMVCSHLTIDKMWDQSKLEHGGYRSKHYLFWCRHRLEGSSKRNGELGCLGKSQNSLTLV